VDAPSCAHRGLVEAERAVMIGVGIALVALALAFANGANDNFKGVATLHGCGRLRFGGALRLATLSTLAGSLSAIVFSAALAERFSGKGLLPDAVVGQPVFVLAAALGAAATVLLATRLGLPVSTTHALAGGLLGGGLVLAGPAEVKLAALGSAFVLPLVASPLMALVLAAGLRPALRRLEQALPPEPVCLCAAPALEPTAAGAAALLARQAGPMLALDGTKGCERHGARPLVTLEPRAVIDVLHVASAGAVGFARGLNDAPKIAGLLIGLQVMAPGLGITAVALVMAFGGLLAARRVARTVAFGITGMNDSEGLSANLVTAGLVLLASPLGFPVSTTHVSCGSLFGIGATNGEARWRMIAAIAAAWAITLPAGAVLSAIAAVALRGVIE
jgi:PiT family inorganic phosphate transporter